MKSKKIVHVLAPDKFSVPFIRFINKEFDSRQHIFLCTERPADDVLETNNNIVYFLSPYRKHFFKNLSVFRKCIRQADKIILHGNPILYYFLFAPSAIKKIYWMILGYELGDSSIAAENTKSTSWQSRIKNFVLKKIPAHITHIKGDSDLANVQQHSSASFFYSPMYLSNVVPEYQPEKTGSNKEVIKIVVGNSTCPTNDHISIFEMLLGYKSENIIIYCPLSYGNYDSYRDSIIEKGKALFGDKFVPILQFMKPEEYNAFLTKIDIAIFNHKRQEAMGVTLALLNMGKVVYMNPQTTAFNSLNERGITVFDNNLIHKDGLFANRGVSHNPGILQKEYSYHKLKESLTEIFNN